MDIEIKTDFIKISQLLKLSNIISSGSDAKHFITENNIVHNNVLVTERGKKIYKGDTVVINDSDTIHVC